MADDMVTLTLAHPMTAEQSRLFRAKDVKDYDRPGMKITVPRDDARRIIDAGYAAGIEPTNTDAVAAALESKATKSSGGSASSS